MKKIPVFYDDRMNATPDRTDSPSAGKPALVVTDWQARGLQVERAAVTPATPEQFKLAHHPGFVDGVLACKVANGFGCTSASVARALPWTTGSMLSATEWVLDDLGDDRGERRAAVSPTSGFHHAGYDSAEGFCTFNGLAVTALALIEKNPGMTVGILDCDEHFGNGTEGILYEKGRIIVGGGVPGARRSPTESDSFLIGDDDGAVVHWSSGRYLVARTHAATFLRHLPTIIEAMATNCDIILYQAGADQHHEDPYGGMLDNEQLRERDRIVFEACARLDAPIVWNLAGGYQRDAAGSIEPVLAIHRATMEECIAAFVTSAS